MIFYYKLIDFNLKPNNKKAIILYATVPVLCVGDIPTPEEKEINQDLIKNHSVNVTKIEPYFTKRLDEVVMTANTDNYNFACDLDNSNLPPSHKKV
jgi:hypothetical protein